MRRTQHGFKTLLIVSFWALATTGCGGDNNGGGGGGGDGEYTCTTACSQLRSVCGRGTSYVDDSECVADCEGEPWPVGYIECVSLTCQGDTVCEDWDAGDEGQHTLDSAATCTTACSHLRGVCGRGTSYADDSECVADCEDEPWPEGYIECVSLTCQGDTVCEDWDPER